MLYLLGGFAILCGLLLLGYLFVNAEPARLARILKWTGIVVAGLAVVALAISGRLSLLLTPLLFAVPALRRLRTMFAGFRGPSAGSSSTVEAYLDRADPDWHEDFAGAQGGSTSGSMPPPRGSTDVTVEEAYEILGLAPGAEA